MPPIPSRISAMIRLSLIFLALFAFACSVDKPVLISKNQIQTLDGNNPYLEAHLKNGGMFAFARWDWTDSSRAIHGSGKLLDINRVTRFEGDTVIDMDSVAVFATNKRQIPPSVAVLGILTGASLAMTLMCISNPKACFGSCPTFYVGGEKEKPAAEGFSGSIAPSLEAMDWDPLGSVPGGESHFELEVRNEALETHAIRSLHLLAFPNKPGQTVLADAQGRFQRASWMRGPDECRAEEGDCREALAALDGEERSSLADSADLAARETLDFTVNEWPGGEAGVAIAARQSLLSTFLFYQMLSYMGSQAPAWFARLETQGPPPNGTPADYLGGIEVLQMNAEGIWQPVGEMREHGPLAVDRQVLGLGHLPAGKVHLRLRLAKGNWRLDQVALVKLEGNINPIRLEPRRVVNQGKPDGAALANLNNPEGYLLQMPGDSRKIAFDLPAHPKGWEVFLESRGYYWEWMREEWLKEENPELAARMVFDPAESLRDLAPRFKQTEAGMEKVFWSSRYAR